jgi:hypothetical protein
MIVPVSVLNRINESLVKRNKQIRALGFDNTQLGHSFEKVMQNAIHQRNIAW